MKKNPKALIPILVFLVLYLGLGILFEFVMKIDMGFYLVPIMLPLLIAIFVACVQNRSVDFSSKLQIMASGLADKNIITMILIFLIAGCFAGVCGRSSAENVAFFMLSIIPPQFSVVVLFLVACFVSTSMGTSVGTITILTPIAAAVSQAAGFPLPLCVGSIIGGAMFGDNLSFISDTTIASCNGQGCRMKDEFLENFRIALPSAIITIIIIFVLSSKTSVDHLVSNEYNLILVIPYVIVLVLGIVGINVFIVLIIGIIAGLIIVGCTGTAGFLDIISSMGTGMNGMFETSMVAILVTALCALIRHFGGFDYLLSVVKSVFKTRKGGQLGIGLTVSLMDIATANNTVAIVMANPIASEMAEHYDISPRTTAALLDRFSCIVQGIIPYGAQILVAISSIDALGMKISAFEIIPNLIYPLVLLAMSIVFVFLVPIKTRQQYFDSVRN